MDCEIVNVVQGDDLYEELLSQIRDDPGLLQQMWQDAEHRLIEVPGKIWTIAVVWSEQERRWVPAAWAAACEVIDDAGRAVLRCSDNYERRGVGRDHGLHGAVYRHRHETVVAPSGLPAVTYLFAEPIPPHERDGWYKTGLHDVSREPGIDEHPWWELRRDP